MLAFDVVVFENDIGLIPYMIKALEEKNDGLFDYAAKASDLTCAK